MNKENRRETLSLKPCGKGSGPPVLYRLAWSSDGQVSRSISRKPPQIEDQGAANTAKKRNAAKYEPRIKERSPTSGCSKLSYAMWDFPKIRVPYVGVLMIRILLFRVL